MGGQRSGGGSWVCLSVEQLWKLIHHLPHSCPLESNSKHTGSDHDEERQVHMCVCKCVCFFSVTSARPGVGEASGLCSRLSVWQTTHCGIWTDLSLVGSQIHARISPVHRAYISLLLKIILYWDLIWI